MIEFWVLVAIAGTLMKTAFGTYQKHLTLDFDAVEMTYAIALVEPVVFHSESYPVTFLLAAALSVVGAHTVMLEDTGFLEPLKRLNTRSSRCSSPRVRPLARFLPGMLATAACVSLVFQPGIIFTVLAGGVFFDERYLGRRIIGGLLIISGVVLISI